MSVISGQSLFRGFDTEPGLHSAGELGQQIVLSNSAVALDVAFRFTAEEDVANKEKKGPSAAPEFRLIRARFIVPSSPLHAAMSNPCRPMDKLDLVTTRFA